MGRCPAQAVAENPGQPGDQERAGAQAQEAVVKRNAAAHHGRVHTGIHGRRLLGVSNAPRFQEIEGDGDQDDRNSHAQDIGIDELNGDRAQRRARYRRDNRRGHEPKVDLTRPGE